MSDRLWTVFAELAKHYREVTYRQDGLYYVVELANKGRIAAVSDFELGWWLELRQENDSVVKEAAIETVDELLAAVREWLDQ
jgi:hypothetical protein